jgi:FemAB-related protein (PEP-CTERM system-associated)
MNACLKIPAFTIRTANLGEADEAARIDAFVRLQDGGTPFHLTAWARAIAQGCGQKPHYLVAEDGAGAIAGLLPMTEVGSPLFGRALVSAGFAVGGGVLSDSDAVANQLIAAATHLSQALKCPTVELRGGLIPDAGWHVDDSTYLGFARALAADDEAELLAIPRKQRAEVRKALGFDLTIETGTTKRDRDAHYTVYATSVRNLGTPVFPRALFHAVLDEFGSDADILTIRRNGEAVASVLSLYHRGVVMPYWGGGTADARTWRANDLMYYALMLHARQEKGCTRFDFGRSKAGTGPAAFKRNWGFEPQPLTYGKYAPDGQKPREINPLDPKYRLQVQLWQKMPLWLANMMGPIIAKGLG